VNFAASTNDLSLIYETYFAQCAEVEVNMHKHKIVIIMAGALMTA